MKKRFLAVLLALVMVCSMLPTTVLAAAQSGSVALSSLALYDTIAVGTEITELTDGLNIGYFTSDSNIAVHKTYTGTSCTVEGSVSDANTSASIAAPQNGTWELVNIDTASNSITLRSTDPVPAYTLTLYFFDPNKPDKTVTTDPTDSWVVAPVMEGYDWYGWALLDGTPTDPTNGSAFHEDTEIFGRWTNQETEELYPALYNVTFNYADDATEAVVMSTDLRGNVAEWPDAPTRSGFIFEGWADADGNVYTEESVFTADTELTAQWAEQITVTFYAGVDSTDILKEVTLSSGSTLGSDDWPEIGTGVGVTFEGWFLSDDTKVDGTYMFTEDTDVYAHVTYSETVMIKCYDGTELVGEFEVVKGDAFNDLPAVSKDGYVFVGWVTKEDDESTLIGSDYLFNEHTDLYALLKEGVTITYYVDDEVFLEETVLKDVITEKLPAPTKDGYKFVGWATTKDDSSSIIESVTPTEDIKLYAIFEEDSSVVKNPIVKLTATIANGKVSGLPALEKGLKYVYVALAEGDKFMGETVTKAQIDSLLTEMNSMIGEEIGDSTIDEAMFNLIFTDLTDTTTITKTGEFALIILSLDSEKPAEGNRCINGVFAEKVTNTIITPGEIEDASPSSNVGGAKITSSEATLKKSVPFTDAELKALENGEDIQVWIEVTDIATKVSSADKKLVNAKRDKYIVGMYVDIDMFKQVGTGEANQITKLNDDVTISLTLPDKLILKNSNLFRNYRVIRVHNGAAEVIKPTYNKTTQALSFETDRFSTYAVAYYDSTVPATGDNSNVFLWSSLLAVSVIGLIITAKKRKHN